MRLESIDEHRVVIAAETTVIHRTGGQTQSSDKLTFRARETPGEDPNDLARRTTTGEETLVINGKKIATKWESVASPKGDPLTFIKTWRSDEVPGALVLEHRHTHRNIVGQDYRDVEETIYAPVDGVEPEVGPENSSGPAPAGYVVQSGGPNQGSPAAAPAGRVAPATQAAPGAPPAPAGRASPQTSGAPAPSAPAPQAGNAAGQRSVDGAEAYRRQIQKNQECLQQTKKDHPEGGAEFAKEFRSCIQAK
jgi:hypothetical protein